MERRKAWLAAGLLLGIVLGSAALPVHADIGPKPSMDFSFVSAVEGSPAIVEAVLYECSDVECGSAQPLDEMGPQGIWCGATECTSMAYGYTEYFRLKVRFSDGVTRESNVFGKRAFRARYTVTIEPDALTAKEDAVFGNLFTGPLYVLALLTFGTAVLILPALAVFLLVLLGIWSARLPRPEGAPKRLYVLTWVVSGVGFLIGLLAAWSVPLTVILELLVLVLYLRLRGEPLKPWVTLGVAVNLVTQPILWSMALGGGLRHFPWLTLAAVELGIWLVEAVLLYLPLRRRTTFLAVLGLSLMMNAFSFGLGLLLPV